MEKCVFCDIVNKKIDSAIIWEDKEFIAFLDGNPNTIGMTCVIPKKHYNSYAFDMPKKEYSKLMKATKKVAKILEKGLSVQRVAMVMEGLSINHVHIKLYPIYGLKEKFEEIWAKETIFFDKYEGFISTKLGPKIDIKERKELVKKILSKINL
jgi:histidine triad (HIT) family protein